MLLQNQQTLHTHLKEIQLRFRWDLLHRQPVTHRMDEVAVFYDCELVVVVKWPDSEQLLRLQHFYVGGVQGEEVLGLLYGRSVGFRGLDAVD